jgi:predicted ribosome quality control (RQC) complex YloA/Tae2 family protein
MNNLELEEAQLKQKTAGDAVYAQLAKIKAIESRFAQIDFDLQKLDDALIDAAVTNNQAIDWTRHATAKLGLELEKATLPNFLARLKESLSELQLESRRAKGTVERLNRENSENIKVEEIKKMVQAGQPNKVIQTKLAMEDHVFYRLLALAKRPEQTIGA